MTDWKPFDKFQAEQPPAYGAPSSELYSPYSSPQVSAGSANFRPPHSGQQTTNGLAVTSMILGIVSFAFGLGFLIIPLILAIVFGHIAIGQINRNPQSTGKGMAIAGLIMGYIGIAIAALFFIVIFAFANEASEEFERALQEAEQNQERITIPDQE